MALNQASLELRDLSASTYLLQDLKVCTITPDILTIFNCII